MSTVKELRALAKERNIVGYSKMNKAELEGVLKSKSSKSKSPKAKPMVKKSKVDGCDSLTKRQLKQFNTIIMDTCSTPRAKRDKKVTSIINNIVDYLDSLESETSSSGDTETSSSGESETVQPGKVYIAAKRRRGVKGEFDPVVDGATSIDVTSGSNNKILCSRDACYSFSPMYIGPIKYKDDPKAKIFENYWQGGKVFKELGHIGKDGLPTEKWFEFRKKVFNLDKGKRHPPGTKSDKYVTDKITGKKKYIYYRPQFGYYGGEKMDYITSRKKVYAPIYASLVKDTPVMKELQRRLNEGESFVLLDVDGPRTKTGEPLVLEVDIGTLKKAINDETQPFGHGYVASAVLADIPLTKFTM